jgi:DNA-binding transcriptional ArsR family regulator
MAATQFDTYLTLLSDRQRRRIIHQLRTETAEKTTVEDLVNHLYNGDSASLTTECPDRDQLSIQLIHTHLPKLDEHEIIEYDRENNVVRYRPDEQIETILDALPVDVAQTTPGP